MSGQKLAQIAAELFADLEEIGFGAAPNGDGDRPVNGADLVDLMNGYHSRLARAVNAALGRNQPRQEGLDLN